MRNALPLINCARSPAFSIAHFLRPDLRQSLPERKLWFIATARTQLETVIPNQDPMPTRLPKRSLILWTPRVIVRAAQPVLEPELPYERTGQYKSGTTFAGGWLSFMADCFFTAAAPTRL